MYHRSLALALTAFLLVALVRIPAVSADDTQDKALESLDCWVLANKDEFVVKNVGEVSAQVTSIVFTSPSGHCSARCQVLKNLES